MGWSPEQSEAALAALDIGSSQGTWLRIRGMADSEVVQAHDDIGGRRSEVGGGKTAAPDQRLQTRRTALAALRDKGHRLVAMIRWSNWESSTRPTPARLPLDLRDAYQRCRDLAQTYGDVIDAWEIENEPDISFVPENAETFAAFYKACSLGILAGREQAQAESRGQKMSENGTVGSQLAGARAPSAVMHSPMALPPGPYWQELVANDVLRYTEAFNYHFYGYPEDFQGVRDAWIAALDRATQTSSIFSPNAERSDESSDRVRQSSYNAEAEALAKEDSNTSSERPALPLFLTEYGYGLLDRFDRFTIEGRERQKRFFELTLSTITDYRISGAMVFRIPPLFITESGNQFGLLAEVPEGLRAESQGQQGEKVPDEPARYQIYQADSQTSEPPNLASPNPSGIAGLGVAQPIPRSRDWVKTSQLLTDGNRPSQVVIDLIAGEQTQSVKRYNGHLLRRVEDLSEGNADKLKTETLKSGSNREGEDGTTKASRPAGVTQSVASKADEERNFQSTSGGEFTLVLYNFSDEPVTGVLRLNLENGEITQRRENPASAPTSPGAPSETSPDASRQDESADLSGNLSAVALAKEEASAQEEASAKVDYRRPDAPRSSLRPPEERTWPNADTRIVTTDTGKTYAITPALELLLQAAEAGGRMSEVRNRSDATGEGEEKPEVALPMGISPNAVTSDEATRKEEVPAFVSNPITLAPMERREFKFTATLPNQEFRPYRMTAIWLPDNESNPSVASPHDAQTDLQTFSPDAARRDEPADLVRHSGESAKERSHFEARLTTQLYPSPAAFRLRTINAFEFTAEDNADARARQLARPRAEGEARLYQHPTAQRWLSTPGVHIEETFTGWRITVNDLPPEPLRPAELELPLPNGWTFSAVQNAAKQKTVPSTECDTLEETKLKFSADTALSLKYRLIPPKTPAHDDLPTLSASPTPSHLPTDLAHAPNRFEEFDLNLRDANGTLWSVWPRLFARREPQTYLEPITNFTPMFFSRAPAAHRLSVLPKGSISASERFSVSAFSQNEPNSLVLLLRPRTLPTTIEITFPRTVEFAPRKSSLSAN